MLKEGLAKTRIIFKNSVVYGLFTTFPRHVNTKPCIAMHCVVVFAAHRSDPRSPVQRWRRLDPSFLASVLDWDLWCQIYKRQESSHMCVYVNIIKHMNLRPGFKEEGLVIFISKLLLKLMSEPPPPCRDCGGKFPCPQFGNWCSICSLLGRLRIHINSDRFPVACTPALENTLWETLWRILEVSDTYWAANPNLQAPPPAPPGEGEVKPEKSKRRKDSAKTSEIKPKEEEEPAAPATTAKSSPPKPNDSGVKVESTKEADKSPVVDVRPEEPSRSEKSRSKESRKKRSRGDREGRSRSRKRRRRRRESSKSREGRDPPRAQGKVRKRLTPPLHHADRELRLTLLHGESQVWLVARGGEDPFQLIVVGIGKKRGRETRVQSIPTKEIRSANNRPECGTKEVEKAISTGGVDATSTTEETRGCKGSSQAQGQRGS